MTTDQGPRTAEPPGCLVLLLRLSADMTAEVVTGRGESVAFASARFLADELLEGLVNTVAAGYALEGLDVAVLGYRTGDDGAPQLFSLLPGGDPKPRFVPLAQIAEMPAEARAAEGQPRKWTVLPPCEGEQCTSDALARVYQMVATWLTGRFAARPPVVIHCTTTEGLDDAYFRVARSLGLLTTGYGPVRLLHYVFDATNDEVRHLRLLEVSGEVPGNAEWGKAARRGMFINDWDITDPWDALFICSWREDAVPWAEAGAGFDRDRAMWAQKMGNTSEQWEDAFAVDVATGAAAVADGASTGIYCRIWADQLSRRFLSDRPDTRDPGALNKWVGGLRREWREAIQYDTLNWSKQAKVDQVGAAATLLGLEVGPADAQGNRPWRAFAVGDASLFWLRGGRLLASFPVVADNQFGSAPLLIRSNPGFRTVALAAEGVCEPGDRFLLATDAVAARLFKSAANGPGPEWARFEAISQDEWRADLDTLRRANDMVNDDCTLVVLRVSGGPEEPEWPPVASEASGDREAPDEVTGRAGGVSPLFEQPQEDGVEVATSEEHVEAQGEGETQRVDEAEEFEKVVETQQGADAPRSPEMPEQQEQPGAEAPPSPPEEHDGPPPADEPPAARDGFPDSTDPSV